MIVKLTLAEKRKLKSLSRREFLQNYLENYFRAKDKIASLKISKLEEQHTFSPTNSLLGVFTKMVNPSGTEKRICFRVFIFVRGKKISYGNLLKELADYSLNKRLSFAFPKFVLLDKKQGIFVYEDLLGDGLRPFLKGEKPISEEFVRQFFHKLANALVGFNSLPKNSFPSLKKYLPEKEISRLTKEIANRLAIKERQEIAEVIKRSAKIKLLPSGIIHGDFSPSNIVIAKKEIGFLDFDYTAVADPVLDLASFWSQLEDLVMWGHLDRRKADLIFDTFKKSYQKIIGKENDFEKRLEKSKIVYLLRILKFNLTAPARGTAGVKGANLKIIKLLIDLKI